MNLCDYNTIRDLLARHGFHFSKSMGQNFLIDPEVPRRIAEASGADAGCGVLEIGPGIGPLTAELAQRAGKVVAVELDRALLPVLAETMAPYPNVEVVPGDVLKLDLTAIAAEKFQGLTPIVCANLPYNVTSPILEKLVESPCFTAFTVMIQREVARRLCAPQGSSEGGSFSLFLQYYMKPELLFDVPPEKFLPAPKVTSTVIRMTIREKPPAVVEDPDLFFQVVRAAFAQRRKTLVNCLYPLLEKSVEKQTLSGLLHACNLTETIRGERLTFADFAQLTGKLKEIRGS